jgi:soluble lytic murein transglycosylase-like protein
VLNRIGMLSVITVYLLSSSTAVAGTDWRNCGEKLQQMAGRQLDLETVHYVSARKDSEFLTYLLALAYVESRFITTAISSRNARGIMQLTPPAVTDAGEYCRIPRQLTVKQLHNMSTNVTYGSCFLARLREKYDWVRTLIYYNSGLRGLFLYEAGVQLPTETANYVLQVQRLVGMCSESPAKEG